MLQSTWLFIGAVAFALTIAVILTPDDAWAIILGVAGFLSWAIFAYGAFSVTVVGESVTYEYAMPVAAFFGMIMSFIPAYIALTGPADMVASRWKQSDVDDL